jgi:hypothetical protein
MEIKVGDKFKNGEWVETVLAVHEKGVLTEDNNGTISGYAHEEIENYFEPIKPKYVWKRIEGLSIAFRHGGGERYFNLSEETKDFEILLNYRRYREQFDNVDEKSHEVIKYDGEYAISVKGSTRTPLGLDFSTKEHAQNFIELLKENVK